MLEVTPKGNPGSFSRTLSRPHMSGAVSPCADQYSEDDSALRSDDLAHRFKNLLATVSAVVNQTMRDATSLVDARDAIAGRIATLAKAQECLLDRSDGAASLTAIVGRVLAPFLDEKCRRFDIAGPEIGVSPEVTSVLCLTLFELATNAIKYGALSVPEGQVAISWRLHEDDRGQCCQFAWREQGGPLVVPPARTGFGTTMIGRIWARSMAGRAVLAFPAEGVTLAIELPLQPAHD